MTDEKPVQAAEPSPAPSTIMPPKDSADYATWRTTGKLPEAQEAKPLKLEDAAASDEKKSDTGDEKKPEQKGAPASEAGKEPVQEKKPKLRSDAATRLEELLDDLKRVGLSPAELKTFKREALKTPAEPVEKPLAALERPVRPKYTDFDDADKYETAMDKYEEDLAEFKATQAVKKYQVEEMKSKTHNELAVKLTEAKTRYGEEAHGVILKSVGDILSDTKISSAVKVLLNESPVLVDLLYVMGSDEKELSAFIDDARLNPGAAIRKAVLLERLVMDELSKSVKPPKAGSESSDEEAVQLESKLPGKKSIKTPPPPDEVSGTKGSLPDEAESAFASGKFAQFRDAQNRKDLARMKGL